MRHSHWAFLLFCTASLIAVSTAASAQGYSSCPEPLQPRIEAGAKAGTERSMGTMEGWMPLVQDDDSVLYGDIRWMADDEENQEGNLGIGYRTIQGDHIIGAHGWIDRRRTDRGSTFYQVTGGVEFLKEDWDVKANAYVPLNKEKEYATANIGQSSPYMAGTGLFVDTNGTIIEETQPGGDIEVGYRLPVLEKHIDAVRVYGGGYAFIGDVSDDTVGGRVRASVDINPLINVGARFQYDEPRGSQGFIEATLRFPFTAKKRFQQHGLRARLDESPERDIDIVTGAQVDTGLRKEVVNVQSGATQRVIHVDNTAANGGNGSKENPFNTLAAAQAAMLDNDVIYVHRGNGTSTGMNQGVVINRNNVQLIGSGTDFIFDTDKFTTRRPGQKPADGTVIVAGGLAPVITNITTAIPGDEITGNGVTVLADNAVVSGLRVDSATNYGIRAAAIGAATHFTNVTITNNITNGNAFGILAHTQSGGQIDNILIEGNTLTDTRGIYTQANTGNIGTITIRDNNARATGGAGITVAAINDGLIGDVTVDDNIANNSLGGSGNGLAVLTNTNSIIDNITIRNNEFKGNAQNGLSIHSSGNGHVQEATIEDNETSNNGLHGIYLLTQNTAQINDALVRNNTVNANTQNGIRSQSQQTSSLDTILDSNIVTNNQQRGIDFVAQNASSMAASVSNNTVTGNAIMNNTYGVYVFNDTTGTYNIDLGGGSLGSTGGNRIYNNIYRDVYIDSRPGSAAATPGTTISAQHNWWGVNTGLNQGTRVTFDNGSASPGSSIDASNFLTTDPGI